MRISSVLLFLFSCSAFAQSDVAPLLNVLENPTPDAQVCTQADFQSCVTALCGDRTRYQRRQDADYEALYDAQAFGSLDSVRTRIRATLERQRQRNVDFARDMKTRIAAGTFTLNTESWDEFMWDDRAHAAFANNIEWDLDRNAPLDRKISYRLTGLEGRSPAFRSALEAYAREELRTRADLNTLLGNNLLTDDQLRETIAESQRIAGDAVTPELRARLERGENLQSVAWDFYILRPREKQSKYTCRTAECRTGLAREVTTQLVPGLTRFEDSNLQPDFVDRHLPQCLSAFVQSAVRAPESEAMIASFPAMRENFLNTAMSNLSAHSRDAFKKYLEEEVDYSTNMIQNPRTSLDSSFAEAGKPYPNVGTDILTRDAISSGPKDRMNPLLGLDVCVGPAFFESDSFTPNPVIVEGDSDGNTRVLTDPNRRDRISLSGFNCAHPDLGEGVFLHELGHALSFVLSKDRLSTSSKETFLNLRNCIRGAGPDLPGNERFPGDRRMTEEDMADFLAAKIPSTSPNPSSCQLISEMNLMVMNNRESDHAPSMVRLIRDARARGALPPACQPIYQQYHSEFRAESCSR
ncbi:MAG: hypothetical protein V4598_10230 [Bdellovibrionota bacterium]